jgi:hypothetical protein
MLENEDSFVNRDAGYNRGIPFGMRVDTGGAGNSPLFDAQRLHGVFAVGLFRR